ncbi:MAG: GHKL domain-containing protein, partial [bacterium]|nr:GHKL domain-containing protein [bacterium]
EKKLTIGFTLSTAPFAISCISDSFIRFERDAFVDIALMVGVKLFFWISLYLLVLKLNIPKDFDLPKRYWNILLLISCIPFLVLLSLIIVPDDNYKLSASIARTIICILVIIILSVVGILYAIAALYKASQLEEKQMLSEVNEKYYKNMENQMFQIRQFRHDLNNHLQVLANLPVHEMKDYVNKLLSDRSIAKPISFCRNSVINALLGSKYDYIETTHIDFHYDISLEDEPALSPTDLCALVGNLLDNAIEGCLKPDTSRFIRLDLSCAKGLFVIKIVNSCLLTVDTSRTSKTHHSSAHGFGIKSIREIVERNNGTVTINHENGIFEVFVVIPQ